MTEQNDNSDSLADILELGGRRAAPANGTPRTIRPRPVCAVLSLALPLSGILLTFFFVSAIGSTGDFACFAPAIIACLAAFPLSSIGVALAAVAFARREKRLGIAVVGAVLNVLLLLLSAPLVWTAIQR